MQKLVRCEICRYEDKQCEACQQKQAKKDAANKRARERAAGIRAAYTSCNMKKTRYGGWE